MEHNIDNLYNNSPYKKWIKLIDFNKLILFKNYDNKDYFKLVANVSLDNEIKQSQKKKRKTLIKFTPFIKNDEYNEKTEWLYIFTINDKIVKIGGTRTGIKGRITSYLCGHHIVERGKSGDCSKTNGIIYNTFEFYLNLGYTINMYGYKLPKTEINIEILGKSVNIIAQTFHAYESMFLKKYKKKYNEYPILCNNCDPDY